MRKLRILWCIHLYVPRHNCGSEYVAHCVNKYLLAQGHEVRVVLQQGNMHGIQMPYVWEGVEVMAPISGGDPNCRDQFRWADVICTHLDYTKFSIVMGYTVKRPVVHFIHNDILYPEIVGAFGENFIVYNSKWIADKLAYDWPSMTLVPPCDYRYYDVCENPIENKYITLISLNKNKGGEIFYEVARRMPEKQFLGVRGSYDEQLVEDLPNVTIIDNTPDILSVYKQTRILLMPSRYESWGRTATEAMCSGIPVICCPTDGLKENCADAALYCTPRQEVKRDAAGNIDMQDDTEEPYDVSSIIKQIKKLDNPAFYQAVSEKSRERSRQLDPQQSFKELEQFLYSTQSRQYA